MTNVFRLSNWSERWLDRLRKERSHNLVKTLRNPGVLRFELAQADSPLSALKTGRHAHPTCSIQHGFPKTGAKKTPCQGQKITCGLLEGPGRCIYI